MELYAILRLQCEEKLHDIRDLGMFWRFRFAWTRNAIAVSIAFFRAIPVTNTEKMLHFRLSAMTMIVMGLMIS